MGFEIPSNHAGAAWDYMCGFLEDFGPAHLHVKLLVRKHGHVAFQAQWLPTLVLLEEPHSKAMRVLRGYLFHRDVPLNAIDTGAGESSTWKDLRGSMFVKGRVIACRSPNCPYFAWLPFIEA